MRRRVGIEKELTSIVDHRVLRLFRHAGRMDECRMVAGRPMLGWMDGVKEYS